MNDNNPNNAAPTAPTQDQTAIPEEQLGDISGGANAGLGKTVRGEAGVRDDIKVKRDGYGLGG